MLSKLCRLVVLLAGGCITVLFANLVHAQRSATEHAAHMAGLRIDRSMLAGPMANSPRSAMRIDSGGFYEGVQETREMNLIGKGVLLEVPRVTADGQYQRPRLLIGRQSPELRSWMTSMGLPPERCMLPMLRGRMKRAAETGKYGAAVLISARCTFY
jgi:xanthine/CO dehydrogenase XdhC/CoxF family maturation factor